MLETIKKILQELAPAAWRIENDQEESAELFFVNRLLDTRRMKDVSRCSVTLFRVDEAGSKGFTTVPLSPGLSEEEIRSMLQDGYFAASFAMNPGYEQPEPVQKTVEPNKTPLMTLPLSESAGKMATALFAGEGNLPAYINSAEIFVTRTHKRILSSEGTDLSWVKAQVTGEFVAQCKMPEDVEIYQSFAYDQLDEAALTALVKETMAFTADRARAKKILKSGNYDLVLTGDNVRELFFYYTRRASAPMIYPGYSSWEKDMPVQQASEGYEALDLTLVATEPFSDEGIPMKDRTLLDKGVLKTIPGSNRFCRYLETEPTGEYRKLRCENEGSRPFKELIQGPCLWAVTFSDFQMDPMGGYLGGEIRLAYLVDEAGKVTPVTGGSVSASLLDKQGELLFSKERYTAAKYEGPYGIRLRNVSVAGEESE